MTINQLVHPTFLGVIQKTWHTVEEDTERQLADDHHNIRIWKPNHDGQAALLSTVLVVNKWSDRSLERRASGWPRLAAGNWRLKLRIQIPTTFLRKLVHHEAIWVRPHDWYRGFRSWWCSRRGCGGCAWISAGYLGATLILGVTSWMPSFLSQHDIPK